MKSSQVDAYRQLSAWGYAENGTTSHEAIVMRHPVAGVVKIYSSPRNPSMSFRKTLHKAQRQLAAIGVVVTPSWKPTQKKTDRKEATMPRGQSKEQIAAKEQRIAKTIKYLTEHGPSPVAPLAALVGISEQSWYKQYGNRIPGLIRYRELRYQGGTLYGLPNQPAPPNTRVDDGPKQQPPEQEKPLLTGARCGAHQEPAGYPCIRLPGHWGPHRDNHGHEWDDWQPAEPVPADAKPGEALIPGVRPVEPEPITEEDLVGQIERLQSGARNRLAAIEEQQVELEATLAALSGERAFLESFLGVNGTASGTDSPAGTPVPTERPARRPRVSFRQEQIMTLMSDGEHRDYHMVSAALGITPGAASATLSLLFKASRLEMERASYPRRYFVPKESS